LAINLKHPPNVWVLDDKGNQGFLEDAFKPPVADADGNMPEPGAGYVGWEWSMDAIDKLGPQLQDIEERVPQILERFVQLDGKLVFHQGTVTELINKVYPDQIDEENPNVIAGLSVGKKGIFVAYDRDNFLTSDPVHINEKSDVQAHANTTAHELGHFADRAFVKRPGGDGTDVYLRHSSNNLFATCMLVDRALEQIKGLTLHTEHKLFSSPVYGSDELASEAFAVAMENYVSNPKSDNISPLYMKYIEDIVLPEMDMRIANEQHISEAFVLLFSMTVDDIFPDEQAALINEYDQALEKVASLADGQKTGDDKIQKIMQRFDSAQGAILAEGDAISLTFTNHMKSLAGRARTVASRINDQPDQKLEL